jgi:hypothetical protein
MNEPATDNEDKILAARDGLFGVSPGRAPREEVTSVSDGADSAVGRGQAHTITRLTTEAGAGNCESRNELINGQLAVIFGGVKNIVENVEANARGLR